MMVAPPRLHASAVVQQEPEARVDDRMRHLGTSGDAIGLHGLARPGEGDVEPQDDRIVRQRIHVRHLHQGERSFFPPVVPRTDDDRRPESGQDGEQVGGEGGASVRMVPGHEDIAGDAPRATQLIAGDHAGVPLQGDEPGRLFGRMPADHLGREIDQSLDRDRGTDPEAIVPFGDPSELRDPGDVDQERGLLARIDPRRGVSEDELDRFSARLTDELSLESVDLSERAGSVPLPTAAGEVEGPRRLLDRG